VIGSRFRDLAAYRLMIARGSIFETEHWVDVAGERGLLSSAELDGLITELVRTLNGLIRRPSPGA
jgi:four helix bundle protein